MTKLSDITGHTDPFSKATRIKKKKKSSEAKKFSREINKTNYVKKVFSESNKKHTDAAKAIERRVEKRDKDKANGRDDDADQKNPYQNPDGTNKIALAGKRANFVPKQPYMPVVYVRLTKPGSTLQDNTFLELTLPPSNDPKSLSNGNIGLDMTVNRVASNNNPAGLTLQMTFADDTAILVEEALENMMKSPDKGDMGNPDSTVDQPKSNKTKKKNSSSDKNKSTSNKSKKESTSTKKSISFSIPNDPLAGVQTYAYKSSALSNLKKNSLGSFASGISKGISNFFGSFAAAGTTFGNPNNMYAEMGARQLAAANKAKKAKSSSKSKKSSDSSAKGKDKDKDKDKDSSDGSAQTKDTAGLDFYYGYSNSIRSQMYHCTIKDATVEFTAYGTRVTVQAVSTSTAEGAQPQFQFYSSGNPSEIVKEIAQRNGWDIGTINDTQTVYDGPQIAPAGGIAAKPKKGTKKKTYTQKGVGDIEFIRKTLAPDSRSSLNGDSDYVVWLTQGKDAPAINFAPKTQKAVLDKANGSGQPSSTYTFRWGSVSDTTVRSFTPDYSLSKSSFNPESVSASTLEKFSNSMFTTDYNDASSSWMASFAPSISNHEDNYVLTMGGSTYTFQELEGASARMWYLNQNNSYTASMEIMGDPTLQPQNAIAVIIINPNGLPHHTSGIYLIKGITDSIQGGNYTSTLSLIKLPTSPDVGGPDGITGISVHKGDPQDNDGGSGSGKPSKSNDGDDPDGSASGKWVKPISGPWGTNCDGFGPNHPAPRRQNNYHDGYDFGSHNHGPYIRAAHEGYVEEIRNNSTYCYYIAIKSGNIHHIYQEFTNLSQNIYVKKGQHVKTGQKIGKMGSGYGHLHFGINTKSWKESDTHPWGESGNHWKDPYKFVKSHK